MTERPKKVLVMPGTRWQLELVRRIRRRGDLVALVDPHSDCPCAVEADAHMRCDVFDRERVLAFCERERIDAVMSDECDIVMDEIAAIGRRFGLAAATPEVARLYTDKFLMRERCAKIGVPHPEYALCATADEAVAFFRRLGRPVVIKPLDSNSSHGVFTAADEAALRARFDESLGFSREEKKVIVERCVMGTEFTVDGIKTPYGHFTLAISEKRHFDYNPNIACELFFTHRNDRFDYGLLKRTNDRFVEGSGLDFGLTHAEYKFEDGAFYQIEIAARGGGNMISSVITEYMSGHDDIYDYLIDCALGKAERRDFTVRHPGRAAVLKFFDAPSGGGTVGAIRGLETLTADNDVVRYGLNFRPGDVIRPAVSDTARIGYYIACSESVERLRAVMEKVDGSVRIEYAR